MRRSIAERCAADHRNDPVILKRWLGNKTPELFKSWIRPDNTLLVAVEDDLILAVSCVTDCGEITLNYVSPDARFRGASNALLRVLEARAIERGNGASISKEVTRKMGRPTANSARGPATRCQNT
jgi:hypothetical protein